MGGNTRTKSRTHNTPLGGDSAVGLSIGFNLGSSQITLLVWLLSLPACWRLMAWHQCRSVKPQSLVKGSPQRWERLGSNGLGNNMAAQSFFSSIFRYYLAQLSTFSLSKQNLSSFFFPHDTVFPYFPAISFLFSLSPLQIPLIPNIGASQDSVLDSQLFTFHSSMSNTVSLLSSATFLQLLV